jgi:hypothetical protein
VRPGARALGLAAGALLVAACPNRYGVGLAPAQPWVPGQVSPPLPPEAQSCLVACPAGTSCNRRTSQCETLPPGAAPVLYGADAGGR